MKETKDFNTSKRFTVKSIKITKPEVSYPDCLRPF